MIRILFLGMALMLSPADRTESSWTTDDLDIYTTVLRFFSPPRSQVRWIDLQMIPSKGDAMPSAMRDSLIRRAGKHFEGWSSYHESDPRSGGRISLSSINRFSPDSVSVTARYQHRTEYHTNDSFDIRFLIVKRNSHWVLIKP
jgi:hypothetical protein